MKYFLLGFGTISILFNGSVWLFTHGKAQAALVTVGIIATCVSLLMPSENRKVANRGSNEY